MILHSVVISYNRRELTEVAISSYFATVTLPFSMVVVDNGSSAETEDWLVELEKYYALRTVLLGENRYPGYACNTGFAHAPPQATHFHRIDNDFRFLPGWCEEAERCFQEPGLGQLGLRTDEEELWAPNNVGGNMIVRRGLWDEGLRYDERPWSAYSPGYSEDCYLSPAVQQMGWQWGRVKQPCIVSLASGDWDDEYYAKSFGDRGLARPESPPLETAD